MLIDITRRIASLISAAVLAASNLTSVYADKTEANTFVTATEAASQEDELIYQSMELYPNGENSEQVITLDGMMPDGAEAEAVDVSEEHDGIAAYDITITDGVNEFQPDEASPILVEINDPVITKSADLELWHIMDDGTREQIRDIVVREGKISFYATGFSVYEIVENGADLQNLRPLTSSGTWQKIQNVSELANYGENSDGLYISHINGYYITNQQYDVEAGRTGILKTKTASNPVSDVESAISIGAVPYYFESNNNGKYYIFCYDDNESKQYVKRTNKSLSFVPTNTAATVFTVAAHSNEDAEDFRIEDGTTTYCWNQQGNEGGKGFAAYNGRDDKNARLYFWYHVDGNAGEDPFSLNSAAAYGLMAYTDNSSVGTGLTSDEAINFSKMYGIDTRVENSSTSKTLFVTDSIDIGKWKFEWVSADKYKLYDEATGKYLKSDGTRLSVCDAADATAFQVEPISPKSANDQRKRIKLKDKTNNKYICLKDGAFSMETTGTELWFVKEGSIGADQQITYTADRISVSDGEIACDGQEIIIYTRVWNEAQERYDFYAIDYDGSLKRCYAYGDKLMWIDDSINTLLWKLIVYTENDRETGYYDLQNRYSGKYLNPQLPQHNGVVTTVKKPGLLLPGRTYEVTGSGAVNYGDYYTNILAWDNENYGYAALSNNGPLNTEANAMAFADDYYFAVINKAQNENTDNLHTVVTLDNNDYGIKMKLINFNKDSRYEQNSVLGDSSEWIATDPQRIIKNILSSDIKANDYPDTKANRSLAELFAADKLENVNHLFIKSIHDASGYFEFDSCQNYATIVPNGQRNISGYIDADGNATKEPADENGNPNSPVYDFTVYRELGTYDTSATNKYSLKHGQFYPYNDITANSYANTNGLNEYDALLNNLSDDEPRKYEKLHRINVPDYHLGVELEAKFIQTPNGRDAWGHDVIFEFTGDDDFWLYVDDELVLDLGGIHSAVSGKVNFKTGKVEINGTQIGTLRSVFEDNFTKRYKASHNNTNPTQDEINEYLAEYFDDGEVIFRDYTEHKMRIFYMERGEGASNLHMRFNLSSVTPGNVQFEKQFESEEEGDLSQTDLNAIQFPVQILYKKNDEEDQNWYYLTDRSENNTPSVSYQNSTHTVQFAAEYKPPNIEQVYQNVFFITPGKPLEIDFPDDAMQYQIIECAVNRDIYDVTTDSQITDDEGNTTNVGISERNVVASGNIQDLIMDAAEVGKLPAITLKNIIKPNSIQALNITKKLYSSKIKTKGNELYFSCPEDETREDKTTFNYRLYLSNGTSGELQLASLREYYVLDPQYKVCRWDAATQQFVRYTSATYPDGLSPYQASSLDINERVKVVSHTSPYGSISNIPTGYTVNVPGLLVGTKFMVVERDYEIPVGYNLIDYYCERGYQINDIGGKFKITVDLEWQNENEPNEEKLVALYKSDNLLYGYSRKCSESSSGQKTIFEFDYKESKAALSNADQYKAYEFSVEKTEGEENVPAVVGNADHTLNVNNYAWGNSASVGQKVTLAVYKNDDTELMPDQITELVFPDTSAVFRFDENEPVDTSYHVKKVTVTKGNELPFSMNGALLSSYDIDKKYYIDGVEYNAAANSAGTIKSGVDASVTVNNCRGFGIRANKIWSDADFTTSHGNIYTAVYLDDTMLNGTLKCLASPNTAVQYYFDSLQQGKHLSNYGIYEVELTNPVVDEKGYVISYDSLRRLEKITDDPNDKKFNADVADRNDTFKLRVTKRWTNSQTGSVTVGVFDSDSAEEPIRRAVIEYPDTDVYFDFGVKEDTVKAAGKYLAYEITEVADAVEGKTVIVKGARLDTKVIPDMISQEYTVTYSDGVPYKTNDNVGEENARTDTIRNTRRGGIEINLHEWNNTSAPDRPLEGGSFQLFEDVTDTLVNYAGEITDTELYQKCEKIEMPCIENGEVVKKVRYYKLLNTYVSDATGNITVLYNFGTGKYMLRQTVAPLQHIGLSEPVTFEIAESAAGEYTLTNWVNLNDAEKDANGDYTIIEGDYVYPENDNLHPDSENPGEKRNWAEYDVAPKSGVLTAIIDIYNKTYTFDIKKVRKGTDIALPGACFKLYREVMTLGGYQKESNPLPGYEALVSAPGTGIIPKIDNTLAQGTYYLEEESAPTGYEAMDKPIRFSVTENGIVVDNAEEYGSLDTTNSLDGSHVTYVISVPNERSSQIVEEEYYFDIEKTLFLDKYMHEKGDPEQTFLFKVERFGIEDTAMESVQETFYVTLNCNNHVDENFTITDSTDEKFRYDSGSHRVEVAYSQNGNKKYSFPADIRTGKQHVFTKKKGIYRITEVTDWSKTDYEFWKGSNRIKGDPGEPRTDDSVVLTVNDNTKIKTACFANSETEYAYLTSQAWAKNSIK